MGMVEWLRDVQQHMIEMVDMRKCTSCGSENTRTCRHKNARIWCLDCGFVIRDEGGEIINVPDDKEPHGDKE